MLITCMLDNYTHKKSQTILAIMHHICIVSVGVRVELTLDTRLFNIP